MTHVKYITQNSEFLTHYSEYKTSVKMQKSRILTKLEMPVTVRCSFNKISFIIFNFNHNNEHFEGLIDDCQARDFTSPSHSAHVPFFFSPVNDRTSVETMVLARDPSTRLLDRLFYLWTGKKRKKK